MAKRTQGAENTFDERYYIERIGALEKQVHLLSEEYKRAKNALVDANKAYALLLRKHIEMMERCVGIIPKIRKQEEEEDG